MDQPARVPADSSTDVEGDAYDTNTLERTQTGSSTDEQTFQPIRSGDKEELQRIATEFRGSVALSRSQTGASAGLERRDTLVGVKLGDAVLDPGSSEFDVYKWTRMFVCRTSVLLSLNLNLLTINRIMKLVDENDVIQKRAGIVWKNLKVCGSGSAINLQKNVGSLVLAPLRLREFFNNGPEKTILNEFDGVLKTGEMLVVLGRPGSGCSTLLKSLMGELHGLDMKSQSEIHYNGKLRQQIEMNF